MAIFYQPENAVAGDVIPFYENGVFKPFFLRNYRSHRDGTHRDSWVMLSTRDHVRYEEHDTRIDGATGSVIHANGLYHMFYCTFHSFPTRNFVNHAISEDLDRWTDLPGDAFCSDGRIYASNHWRDPFVFWNEAEGCWWMILAAQSNTPTLRKACVGLCKSDDLHTWRYCPPLYAPMSADGAFECPDLFRMGDWYYLVFSCYAERFQTLYRMSKSLYGPWQTPPVDTFDTRALYAAKTASDGSRRFLYGWNPTRHENVRGFDAEKYGGMDCHSFDWGGHMIVHELAQDADGTLLVRPVPSVRDSVSQPAPLRHTPLEGVWRTGERARRCDATRSYGCALLGPVPPIFKLEATVTIHATPARFGIAFHVDESFSEGYYLSFQPSRGRVEFISPLRMTERGRQRFPYAVEMERPFCMRQGVSFPICVLVDETVIESYFGNRGVLGGRMFDLSGRDLGLFVENGDVSFDEIRLSVPDAT